jgi:hypothetical protein
MSKMRVNPRTGELEAEPLSKAHDLTRQELDQTPAWRIFRRRRLKEEAKVLGLASVMKDMPEIGKYL